ncbi:MAG: PrgI family protein, partial [Candidatus Saccharibacteria bacterium]
MSQYKVPQDVEAEDHILGPLTMKQFIYAIVAVAWGGIWFMILKKVIFLYAIVAVPVILLFLLLAFYKRDG